MATRKSSRKSGLLIDVARFVSASQDRSTGRVVFRFRDEQGGWWLCRCGGRSSRRSRTELAEALEVQP